MIPIVEIAGYILVALALSMVPFSVALHSSTYRCIEIQESFEIGIFFSLFQVLLFILGYWIGYALKSYFSSLAFPVASLIFIFIGIKLFIEARKPVPAKRTYTSRDLRTLAGFSLAIGINTFLTGIGSGMIKVNFLYQSGSILLFSYIITLVGVRLGKKGNYLAAKRAEVTGGVIMLLLASYMIVQYIRIG